MHEKIDEEEIEKIIESIVERGVEETLESVDIEGIHLLLEVGVFFREGEMYDIAERVFDWIIQLTPDSADAWYNKGVTLGESGKYEEEISCYDEAIKINPQDADAWYNKGVTLGKLGKYEEEISCYDEAIKINPQDADAWFNRGITFLDLYQYKNAIESFQKANELFAERKLKNDVERTTGFQLWAEAMQHWSTEEYDKAISYFSEAAILFRNLNHHNTANSLELIAKIVPLDHQFLNAIQIQSLDELKHEISEVYAGLQDILDSIKEKSTSEDIEEILSAKTHCFTALHDALQFREVDFEKLDQAKKTFEKLGFDTSIYAVNSLDTIIRLLRKEKSLKTIPNSVRESLLHELNSLSVLDGTLTGKIPIKKERYPAKSVTRERPELVFHFIENIQKKKNWTRICLVQMNFSLDYMPSSEGFGYTLREKEEIKKKVFEALEIASENNVDIICYPELSTAKEWVDAAKKYQNMIIVFGSYYDDRFNICPIIVNGKDYYIRKSNPSPQFETEVIHGMKMKEGGKIFVFQTRCGTFTVLICIDCLKEAHRVLFSKDEKIENVNFIIVPSCSENMIRFHKKGDIDCQEGNHPYLIQVNPWKIQNRETGGTCIIGTEHRNALKRYKDMGLKPDDNIEYKLIELERESMIIVDLDIKRKGVRIPASGPKMKVFQKYIYESEGWRLKQIKIL